MCTIRDVERREAATQLRVLNPSQNAGVLLVRCTIKLEWLFVILMQFNVWWVLCAPSGISNAGKLLRSSGF